MKSFINKIKKIIKEPAMKKKLYFLFIIIGIIFISTINYLNQDELKYSNKKIVLLEPTKITEYNTFKDLCEKGKIDVVYYKESRDTLLFSTKNNTKVNQIDYKHNEIKDIYKKEKKNNKYRENPEKYKDDIIFVYKSFNTKTDGFREYLVENGIQIVDITEKKIDILNIFSMILYGAFIVMIFRTMNIGESDENEEVTGIPNVTFDDIEGNQEAKEEMKVIVDFLENPKKYENMGAKIPKGVILYGPPGTGKTLLAKAIAGEAKVPFFNKSASDFVEIYVGVGAKRVKKLFKKARKKAPCIIFIDEIDAIGGQRGLSKNDEKDQTLNKLLVELDGFNSSERIIVIAATNRVDMLDKALTRSGRFDKHIPIDLPNKKDRVGILNVHLKNKQLDESINIESLAEITSGFSGADIATLVNESAIIACVKNHESITKEDFDEAYVKTAMKSNPKKDLDRSNKESMTIAYHEAGHALVAKLVNNDVHKVTIIGTTSGAGGFTSTSNGERGLLSKQDIQNEVKILLGGRAAEYILFDGDEEKITMGAVNDIERSTSIINNMIRNYGMVIKNYNYKDISIKQRYAPYKIENEIEHKTFMDIGLQESTRLYNETIQLLKENQNLLNIIATTLIEKETISGEELDKIIKDNI